MTLPAEILDAIPERRIRYVNTEHGRDARRDTTLVADVIVVGSGAGGAVTAAHLAEHGLDVLVLEEGALHTTADFTTDVLAMMRKLYRDAGTSMILGKPGIIFAEGRCVGGSTVINGGMTWRTPSRILEQWDAAGLPGTGPRAMEPLFEDVEREVHVETQHEDTFGRHHHMFAEATRKLGWTARPARRNMRRCAGLNNCAFGCPTGAKQSMLVTYIPRALHAGARLLADARVDRVLFDGARAIGVRGRFVGANGRPTYRFTAHAPMVVIAAGARHTPGILKRSWLLHRAIGRNLTTHPNAKAVGIFDEKIQAWKGAHQNHHVHDFLEEGLLIGYAMIPPGIMAASLPGIAEESAEMMELYDHMFPSACLIEDSNRGRVTLGPDREPVMRYSLNRKDIETMHRGVAKSAEMFFAAGARKVLLPFPDLPAIVSADEIRKVLDRKLDARGVELMTVHIMGSCGMATSRQRGATDPWGRVFDVPGLYVADASLFPSPVGVNPQETIMALATRNARHWIESDVRRLALPGRRALQSAEATQA